MPDQTDHDDLDARIRTLVARAVADAPAPPDVEPAAIPFVDVGPDRRRWWLGGGVATLAAAALVTTFVLVSDTDERITTPNTEPATSTTVAPPTSSTVAPATTVASDPSTTTTAPPAVIAGGVTLTAGPNGVVEHRGSETRTLTTEPMAIALDAGDGRVIVQRRTGLGGTDDETVPLVLAADGELTNLFDTAEWDGAVALHDIEVVGGRRLLLFSLQGPPVPQEPSETLYVVDLDTAERTEVAADIGGWEFGTGRLHLAATGLIVGEATSGASHSIFVATVPGSPAADGAMPTAEDLGLQQNYGDCSDCPHAFTVTPDGHTVAWIDGASGMLVARSIDQPIGEPEPIVAVPAGFAIDVDVDDTTALISFLGDPTPAPVMVPLDGSTPATLEGVTATQPPLGVPADPGGPPPPTTTVPPAPPAALRLATAGPDGVTVIENGVEARHLDQPASIALVTPGGAVIFQPAPTTPDGMPGDPMIWRPDGSVEPLLSPLGERQSYRLHDVANVGGGVPTLLYGVWTTGTEPAGYSEVVYALTMTPGNWTTTQIAEINTWEGGFDRLSLSNGGTIVGTGGEETQTWLFSTVVPGSPDSAGELPSPARLGIEPEYSECNECPRRFAISADGESIVWTEGGGLVVFDTASGDKRAWTVPALAERPFGALDPRTSSDGGVEVAISSGDGPSVVVATSPSGEVVETPVVGNFVTFGP